MIAIADADNFFVSCERVFNPSLVGRPVVVLSSNDGCIISRSNEAKALGLKMGQPLYQAKELIEKNNVAVYSTNFVLYGDMSRRVVAVLKEFSPLTEVYSVDESFISLDGIPIDTLDELGHTISRTVRRYTGIPVSVGIAPTKTLAKIASKLCKKYPKLKGCCLMYLPADIEKVLRKFPIGDVWGIGRKHGKMLQGVGVATAYDFTQLTSEWVRSRMGITGLRMWKELRGEACYDLEPVTPAKQQICTSRSFAKEQYELEELRTAVATFTTSCAEKLRKQKSVCGELILFIYTNRHRADQPQSYESRIVRFEVPTDSTLELAHGAMEALRQIFRHGYGYKKAGVILSDIAPNTGVQSALFDTVDREKHSRLMNAVDTLNQRQGSGTVVVAAAGFESVKMNREHLSPRYTTCLDELPIVKV